MPVLILGPLFVLVLVMAYASRNEVPPPHLVTERPSPFQMIVAAAGLFVSLLAGLFFQNLLLDAALILLGLVIMRRGRFYNHFIWVRGKAAKIFGAVWLIEGSLLALLHSLPLLP
jgi:hypothetical protein